MSARASPFRPGMIGSIGVQPLFQSARGQPESLLPRRHLYSLEIQIGNRLRA
jgi:hypothetical protein